MYGLLLFVCWCVSAMGGSAEYEYYELKNADVYFNKFITKYNKQYADENKRTKRFKIFVANLEESNRLNNASEHIIYGITEFMDWSSEEFDEMRSCTGMIEDQVLCPVKSDGDIPNVNLPKQFDWRQSGIVTPVTQQGTCKSCYAFSTAGAIESQYAIKYHQQVILSKQQIVDCDTNSLGCQGGWPSSSMNSLMQFGGSMSEASYPYENAQRQCRSDRSKVVTRLSNCYSYQLSSQESVRKLLVSVGPVSIVVQSDGFPLNYQGSIISDVQCNQGYLNHAVLLVGYGTEKGKPYWLVKNSWGTGWGEQGYFKMERNGPGGAQGACGMLNNNMVMPEVA